MKLVDLIPLQEIDFPNQRAFDQYNKIHKLRPDTEVTVAGRKTTAGRASQNSTPVKGTSVFDKEPAKEKPTPGTKFKNTENGQTMTLKKYDGLGNAIVTSDSLPGHEWTWPADVVDDMIKSGESDEKKVDSKKFPFTVTYLDNDGNKKVADNFVSKRDAQRFKGTIDPKHKPEVVPTEDLSKPNVDVKSLFKNISKLTDINDHNQAAMELAKFMGDKTYIGQMEKIQNYHDKNGSMPPALIQYRTAIVGNLLNQVSKKYGEKVAKQLHNAF